MSVLMLAAGGGRTTTAMHFFAFSSRWRILNNKTGKFRIDFLFIFKVSA
jgi:hypothetical protein